MNGMYPDLKITLIDPITGDILHGFTDDVGYHSNLCHNGRARVRCHILDGTRLGRTMKKYDNLRTYPCFGDFPLELYVESKGRKLILVYLNCIESVKPYKGYAVADMLVIPINNIRYLSQVDKVKRRLKAKDRIYG